MNATDTSRFPSISYELCAVIQLYIVMALCVIQIVFFGIMWTAYWRRKDSKVERTLGHLSWCEHHKALLRHDDDTYVINV